MTKRQIAFCCKKLELEFREDNYNYVVTFDRIIRILHKEGYEDFWSIKDHCPFCKYKISQGVF